MIKKYQERLRRSRIVRRTRKSTWFEYEWQKKRLSQCPEKYVTEARKVAEILGL